VCALQTSFTDAKDWYCINEVRSPEGDRLQPKGATIASQLTKSQNIAIAICPVYNAVAIASDINRSSEVLLEYRQQGFDPLPPSFVLNATDTAFKCKVKRPVSFSFSDCGTRLILLTGHV